MPRWARIVDLIRERSHGHIFGNLLASHDYDLPERLIERAMVRSRMCRIEFLGTGPGMWSLHPGERPPSVIKRLPVLIDRVESGAVTDDQRGFHDVVASMLE